MSESAGRAVLHASAVRIGEAGILIRGPSGAGKSMLARELIQLAPSVGTRGELVGDDRVAVSVESGRLVARPVEAIAGLLEVRGVGIARVPFCPEAEIRLIADIATAPPPRLPDEAEGRTSLLSVEIPRIVVYGEGKALLLLWRLGSGDDVLVTDV